MTRLQKNRSFPDAYFRDVEREIAAMNLRPSLQQAILDNIRRHLERLADEKKDPAAVLGPPRHVAAQVRRQLQERKRQWRIRGTAWFLLFWGWALTLQGLFGLMRNELVWVTAAQVAYLLVAPVVLLALLQFILLLNDWPQEKRRRAYVGLAAFGTLAAAGAGWWLAVRGGDGWHDPLFGLAPWLGVAGGAFVLLVGYRLMRHRR